ncbi:MAG: guanylate kinase [Bacteroidetes bacterium]|nr:guanylate kinase [Bacteroidota bacterium]
MGQVRSPGKLVIFSAPSGAGKTTIVQYLLHAGLNLEFSVSAASRQKRQNETDGRDYYFISPEEFRMKIKNDEFLEWEEVYENHYYGTLKSEVERILENGHHAIFDVDVKGGLNIKKYYGKQALAVFVMPPGIQNLEDRLRGRSTEIEESIKKRIDKAEHEIGFAGRFDKVIVNDDLKTALIEAGKIVSAFLKSKS